MNSKESLKAAINDALTVRQQLITALLDKRQEIVEKLLEIGPDDPESLPAIKQQESELRIVDESIGILRYGFSL